VTKIATYDESGLEEYSNVRPCVGIYVSFWALKHSCVPNTAEVWNGLKIEVRAMRDIEVGDELTRNYMALGIKKSDRSQILVEKFFDKCECN
jgi:SET domain-containing protein